MKWGEGTQALRGLAWVPPGTPSPLTRLPRGRGSCFSLEIEEEMARHADLPDPVVP